MSGDPLRRGTRWPVRRVPPELERAYVDGGWWTDDTLGAMVARQLARHPASTVAIWSRSRPWQGSYADIEDEARRLVALLRDLGVQPGEAVAFQLPNWREAVVSFAALALGGYVLVPIVHIYGRREVAFILEQSGAAAYISPLAYGHVDYGTIVETAAPASLRLHVVVGDTEGSQSDAGPARKRNGVLGNELGIGANERVEGTRLVAQALDRRQRVRDDVVLIAKAYVGPRQHPLPPRRRILLTTARNRRAGDYRYERQRRARAGRVAHNSDRVRSPPHVRNRTSARTA